MNQDDLSLLSLADVVVFSRVMLKGLVRSSLPKSEVIWTLLSEDSMNIHALLDTVHLTLGPCYRSMAPLVAPIPHFTADIRRRIQVRCRFPPNKANTTLEVSHHAMSHYANTARFNAALSLCANGTMPQDGIGGTAASR
jgi:hypothetical protein